MYDNILHIQFPNMFIKKVLMYCFLSAMNPSTNQGTMATSVAARTRFLLIQVQRKLTPRSTVNWTHFPRENALLQSLSYNEKAI